MNPLVDDLLEVAVVVFDATREIERFSSLVHSRKIISLEIERLTGIDPVDIRSAPSFDEISETLAPLIGDCPVVGHSIQFDVRMLEAAGLPVPNQQIDTFHLASVMLPDLPDYSLETVARALDIHVDDAHRALADAVTAGIVLRRLLARLAEYDPVTLDQVAAYATLGGWPTAAVFEAAADEARGDGDADGATRRGPHEMAFLVPRPRLEPLEPVESRETVSEADIDAAFGEHGYIGGAVDRFEYRPQQEYMALRVAEALNTDSSVIAEAGTGTGKSMAYLLPAVLHAREHGERVVISTNTLNLQDQLFRKDIPRLRDAMTKEVGNADDEPFRAVTVKGRNNYLCLRRWFASSQVPVTEPADASLRGKVSLWLGETNTGDRGELRLTPAEEARWRQYSAEEYACEPGRCVFQQRNQCFLFRARRDAESAHLVVVNHALLLSDRQANSGVLPDYDRLVVDEAHHLEDQATMQFGVTVSEREVNIQLDAVMRNDGPIQTGAMMAAVSFLSRPALTATEAGRQRAGAALERARQVTDHLQAARTSVHHLFRQIIALSDESDRRSRGDRSIRITPAIREGYAWGDVMTTWTALNEHLQDLDTHLRWALKAVEEQEPKADAEELAVNEYDAARGDLESSVRGIGELAAQLGEMIANPQEDQVYWLERNVQNESATLKSAPLEVGALLHEHIFGRVKTAVLTSATITTDGTFDYAVDHLGLDDVRQVSVPSPFDYRTAAMLYLADDIPEPNHYLYQQRLNETLIETCVATGGRGLVLFTSHAALQTTYHAIKGPLEEMGIIVLGQRLDGSPRQLIERLKAEDRVVVLGTSSLWEGIDVVGDALSLLVITRLPFSVPSDPVFAARSENIEDAGGNAFLDYAVPQAVLRFKQGFGRLIRSGQDRGICVVLDRRVLSKRYGRSFVDSLPECTVEIGSTFDLPEVAAGWMRK